MINVRYTLQSTVGLFELLIKPIMNRDKTQPESFVVNLGTKQRKCVQFTVPSIESQKTEAKLLWVEAHEECSMEKYIEKGIAQQMVIIGISVARSLNKNIKRINLDDTSSFQCALPNEKEYKVPMKPFHIAFHGATWYEYYFDAMLKKNHDQYEKSKYNRYKSEFKPKEFDFVNQELQQELEPLYHTTLNWNDFFEAIADKYGKKKCGIVYPWIHKAINTMLDSNLYDQTEWYIDLEENIKKNKTPIVSFTLQKIVSGGRRSTIKKTKARRFTYSRTHFFPNIPQIQSWNYKKFINL